MGGAAQGVNGSGDDELASPARMASSEQPHARWRFWFNELSGPVYSGRLVFAWVARQF